MADEEGAPVVGLEQPQAQAADGTVTPTAEGLPEQYAGEDEVVTQGANPYEGNDGHSVNADEAEAAGGIAVGGAAGQPGADSVELAPKNILHEPGINSSEGDVPYVDPESPTTEHDVNTAFDEATAGHDLFSSAANSRRRNLRAEKLQAQHQETADDPRFLKPTRPWQRGRDPKISDWGRERTWQEIADWRDSITEKNDDQGELRALLGEVDGFDTGTFWERIKYAPELREAFAKATDRTEQWNIETARERDEEAKARAEWGGLVAKVSDEYKAAHPECGFGVEEMMAVEKAVQKDEKYLAGTIQKLETEAAYYDGPANAGLRDLPDSIEDTIRKIRFGAGKQDVTDVHKRFDDLVQDRSTTMGNLVDLYKEAMALQIAGIKAAAAERKTVLEDVKSGRASQTPEPTEGQLAA